MYGHLKHHTRKPLRRCTSFPERRHWTCCHGGTTHSQSEQPRRKLPRRYDRRCSDCVSAHLVLNVTRAQSFIHLRFGRLSKREKVAMHLHVCNLRCEESCWVAVSIGSPFKTLFLLERKIILSGKLHVFGGVKVAKQCLKARYAAALPSPYWSIRPGKVDLVPVFGNLFYASKFTHISSRPHALGLEPHKRLRPTLRRQSKQYESFHLQSFVSCSAGRSETSGSRFW